jgi:quercetin dioxygenase-like cupin family protein
MMRGLLTAAVMITAAFAVVRAQLTGGAETDSVVYHDMAAIPKTPYGPFPEARAVLTDSSSVAIATLAPKYRQTIHHHDQEQFTLGLGGAVGYSIGGVHHQLGSHVAGLPPPNVEHGMDNDSEAPAQMMEYQPVLRKEWLPPHASVPPQPQSPTPTAIAANQPVTIDFDRSSSGWRVESNGARAKMLSGQTIRATFWDLAKSGAFVDVLEHPTRRERLVFVLDGHVATSIGAARRDIGPEMLVEVRPVANDVKLISLGSGPALVVVFETVN